MNEGFILIHRKVLDWEWYKNKNDRLVWFHCLLKANWKDEMFKGILIPRGSFVTSIESLSKEVQLTIQQTRTTLNHLQLTNEITYKSNHHFSIITINKYNDYQLDNKQNNRQITNNQQTESNTNNNNRINNNEINKINNNMNIIINNWDEFKFCDEINSTNNEKCQRRSTYNINGKNYCNQHSKKIIKKLLEYNESFKKPTIDEIKEYCKERNNNINAENFYDFYESKDWMVGKNKMKDWKACVRTWERNDKNNEVVPNWYGKEIKQRERSEEDERELQELIRGY